MDKEKLKARCESDKRRREADKERRNAHQRTYAKANKEKIKDRRSAYAKANKERRNARQRAKLKLCRKKVIGREEVVSRIKELEYQLLLNETTSHRIFIEDDLAWYRKQLGSFTEEVRVA